MEKLNAQNANLSSLSNKEDEWICPNCGCQEYVPGIILDPFMGAGTTGLVTKKLNRNYVGIELNERYVTIANKRIFNEIGLFQ